MAAQEPKRIDVQGIIQKRMQRFAQGKNSDRNLWRFTLGVGGDLFDSMGLRGRELMRAKKLQAQTVRLSSMVAKANVGEPLKRQMLINAVKTGLKNREEEYKTEPNRQLAKEIEKMRASLEKLNATPNDALIVLDGDSVRRMDETLQSIGPEMRGVIGGDNYGIYNRAMEEAQHRVLRAKRGAHGEGGNKTGWKKWHLQ